MSTLDPEYLASTVQWAKSLFPGKNAQPWAMRKNLNVGGALYELGGSVNDKPGLGFGSISFAVYPPLKNTKRAQDLSATVYFNVSEGNLEFVHLKYVRGRKALYLDFDTKEEEPPASFAEYLTKGEALSHEKETDPTTPRDLADIKNLGFYKLFAKSPMSKLLAPLYEETVRRYFFTVEREDVHTDTSYEESRLSESALEIEDFSSEEMQRAVEKWEKPEENRLANFESYSSGWRAVFRKQYRPFNDIWEIRFALYWTSVDRLINKGFTIIVYRNEVLHTNVEFDNLPDPLRVGWDPDVRIEVETAYAELLRLLAPVEREDVHTDIGAYEESRLNEGYDPSLDLGPLTEEISFSELKALDKWAAEYASTHGFNHEWNSGIYADYMDFTFYEESEAREELHFIFTFNREGLSKIEFDYYKKGKRLGYVRHIVEEGAIPPRSLFDLIAIAPAETFNPRTRVLEPTRFKEALSLDCTKEANAFYTLFMREIYPEIEREEVHGDIGYEEAKTLDNGHLEVLSRFARVDRDKPGRSIENDDESLLKRLKESEGIPLRTKKISIPLEEFVKGSRAKEAQIPVNIPATLHLNLEWYPAATPDMYDLTIEVEFEGDTYYWRRGYNGKEGTWVWLGISKVEANPEISFAEIFAVEKINSNQRKLLNQAIAANLPALEEALTEFLGEIGLGPVEREDIHTDTGAYEEARLTENLRPVSREEWAALEPGNILIARFRGFETGRYKVISQQKLGSAALPIIHYLASSLEDDWKGLLAYEEGKWYAEKPVEREEIHTDVGAYEESLTENEEVATVDYSSITLENLEPLRDAFNKTGFEASITIALSGATVLTVQKNFLAGGRATRLRLRFKPEQPETVPRPAYFSLYSFYVMVDGNPRKFGKLECLPDAVPQEYFLGEVPPAMQGSERLVKEAYGELLRVLSRFTTVEREDIHTDTGAYEEGLSRELTIIKEMTEEEFDALRPGDTFRDLVSKGEYEVADNSGGFIAALNVSDKGWTGSFFRDEAKYLEKLNVEREEVHTDVGPYEESLEESNYSPKHRVGDRVYWDLSRLHGTIVRVELPGREWGEPQYAIRWDKHPDEADITKTACELVDAFWQVTPTPVEPEDVHTDVGAYEESLLSENVRMLDFSEVTEEEFSRAVTNFKEENPSEAANSVPVSHVAWHHLRFSWISSGYASSYPRASAAGSFALTLEWDKQWGSGLSNYTGGGFHVTLNTSRARLSDWFSERHLPEDLKAHFQDWAARHPNTSGISYTQTNHIKRVTRKQWAEAAFVWEKILASFRPVEREDVHTDIGNYEESLKESTGGITPESIKGAFAEVGKRFPKGEETMLGNFVTPPHGRLRRNGTIAIVRDLPGTNRKSEGRVTLYFENPNSPSPKLERVILTYYGDAAAGLPDANGQLEEMPQDFEKLVRTLFIPPVVTVFEKSPVYAPLKEAYEILYEGLFPPVEREDIHTDVGNYEESLSLKENEETSPYLTPEEIEEVLLAAEEAGITFFWDYDADADLSWMEPEERKEPHECLYCQAENENTGQMASLCGIVDADETYRHEIEADLAMDLGIPRPYRHVEREDVHTDTGSYEESAEAERIDLSEICANEPGYYRLAELLKDGGFKGVEVKPVAFSGRGAGNLTLRAYGETVYKDTGKQFLLYFLIAPDTFSIRPYLVGPTKSYGNAGKEFIARSFVVKNVPREIPYNFVLPRVSGMDYGVEYDLDEAVPEFRKLFELFLDVITSPVSREELHGDTYSNYEESLTERISPEEFDHLKVGDPLIYHNTTYGHSGAPDTVTPEDCIVTEIDKINGKIFITFPDGGIRAIRRYSASDLYDLEPGRPPVEREEVHTDTGAYEEAIERDKNIEEALAAFTGPEFAKERWVEVIGELRYELASELNIRIDGESETARTVMGITEENSAVSFNRGSTNGAMLVQISIAVDLPPSPVYGANEATTMSVHLYGDELKTGADVPETIEALLDFFDSYYIGGPNEKKRTLGRREPGDKELILSTLARDSEYPALEKFYSEFVGRLFRLYVGREEVHTDTGAYEEARERPVADLSDLRPDEIPGFLPRLEALPEVTTYFPGKELYIYYHVEKPNAPLGIYGTPEQLYLQFHFVFANPKPSEAPKLVSFLVEVYRDYDGRRLSAATYRLEKLKRIPAEFPLVKNMRDRYTEFKEVYEKVIEILSSVVEREDVHTDVGAYEESRLKESRDDVPMTKEEWLKLELGEKIVWKDKGRDFYYEIVSIEYEKFASPGILRTYYTAKNLNSAKEETIDIYYNENRSNWYKETPVEPEEVYTDVGAYEESLLRESREVIIDRFVLDAALRWGQETFPGELSIFQGTRRSAVFSFGDPEDYGSTLKVKPAASVKFQFETLANGEEYLNSIIVRYIRPQAYSGGAMEIAIVDIVKDFPIPETWEELEAEIRHKYTKDDRKFLRFFRRLKFFPKIREAYEGFMQRLFSQVEREEVHTDTGAYEESINEGLSAEEFFRLKKGDLVNFKDENGKIHEWEITARRRKGRGGWSTYRVSARLTTGTTPFYNPKIDFYEWDRDSLSLSSPVEREDIHTDVGPYEESRLSEAVIRTSYASITPESAEEGDFADTGWVDEKGRDCEPDEFDREEGLDRVDLAVKMLQDEGGFRYLDANLYEGDPDLDYGTGTETTITFHLDGFSEEELEEIALVMQGGKRPEKPVEREDVHTDTSYEEAAVDPASVRIADYELLRKYGQLYRGSLPELPEGDKSDEPPGGAEA